MKMKRILIPIDVMLLAVLACSFGTPSPAASGGAQTLTAMAQNAATNSTPGGSVTPTVTSTSKPTVYVTYVTSCRTGPGEVYDNVAALPAGFEAEPIGIDTADNYVLVKLPTGEQCWLDLHGAAGLEGGAKPLPEVPPPPTPTPSPTATPHPPAAPENLTGQAKCTLVSGTTYHIVIQLNWTDVADNETKYTVQYLDSDPLPAGATSDTFDTTVTAGTGLAVKVIAQNDVGEASSETKTFTCP